MLELAAVALTCGAVLYHNLHANFFTLTLVAVSFIIFFTVALRTIKGALFALFLGTSFMLGALATWNANVPVPQELFGNRAFDAKVLSIDRRLTKINIFIRDIDHGAKLQLYVYEESGLLPGDIISVRADIEEPESFLTDNGRIFDYPRYLRSKGIVGVGQNAKVLLQKEGEWSLQRIATTARFRIADILAANIAFPIDGVIAGMTVGYQGGLPSYVQDLFRDTGVLHVLVLSGYNITLLAGFLGLLFRAVPFRLRTICIILAIVMLVVISGSGIASVRAGIMGSIALFAGLALRTYRPLRALTLAYLFFFFLSPETIFSDPGFHLSFLATAFMVLVLPKVERLFSFIPKTKGIDIRELLILACTIPLFMLPYTMYFSGNFPLFSPIANIVFGLITPILMILGIALIALSWIAPIAHIIGALSSWIGNAGVSILEVFATMPNWNTPALPWWGVVLFYVVTLYVLFRKEIRQYLWQLRNLLLPATSSSDS